MYIYSSPALFTISDTKPDGCPAAFLFFILLIDFLIISFSIRLGKLLTVFTSVYLRRFYAYHMQTLFLIFITICQYTIIFFYTWLNNNVMLSFAHSFCILKHIAFLVIFTHDISEFFPSVLHLVW